MSNNDTNPPIDEDENGDPEQDQTIEFAAEVVFQALELRRLIEEAEVGLSDTQRHEIQDMLDESGGGGGGLNEEDVLRLIRENTTGGGLTEEDVIRLINEHSPPPVPGDGGGGSGGDGIDPDRLKQLEEELVQLRRTRENFERKTGLRGQAWTVGPEAISSRAAMHTTPLWGVHFETERSLTLGDTTIRSLQPGTVTIRAYEWTGERGSLGAVLGEKEVMCTGQEQTVHLDIDIPAGTEVLLTRPYPEAKSDAASAYQTLPDQAFKASDDEMSLAMEEYDGWSGDSQHGVTFHGKGHPVFAGNSVTYWYYFYSLELTTDVDTSGDV